MRIFFAAFLLSLSYDFSYSQTHTISGTVRDAATREPLSAANVRVQGTSRGTISNMNGDYRLSLPPGSYTLIFSFVSYRSDTVRIVLAENKVRNISLQPSAIQMTEVVVTAEDPAYGIMRKVVENKYRWLDSLRSYQLEAFTRQVLRRDTSIAGITESYTTGYWQKGDTLREVVRQKRQTENVSFAQNVTSIGGILNFYQDEIRFSGFTFIGPTAKNAFDYYGYKLEQTREESGNDIYTIRLLPNSRIIPLFSGTITIVSESYSVIGIEVSPNEAFNIPFVNDLSIRYSQQFALYENRFWMPVDIRIKGSLKIGVTGISIPGIGFEQVSSLYDYKINIDLPDTVFRKPRRTVAAEAERFDSSYWAQGEVLPLTNEEQEAYKTLDSTQTLQRQFQPSGPLLWLEESSRSTLGYLDARFNRVEGFFLGLEADVDSTTNWLNTSIGAGYGFSDKRSRFSGSAEVFLDSLRRYSVGFRASRKIANFSDIGFVGTFGISLNSLLFKNDSRDYFYAQGFELFGSARPLPKVLFKMSYRSEEHSSAEKHTDYSFLYRRFVYRPNPAIDEGVLRSVAFFGRWGNDPVFLNLVSQNFLEIEIERSERSMLKSNFHFTLVRLLGEINTPTFLKQTLFPPTLSVRLTSGFSRGSLPVQRMFTLEPRTSGFGPFGALRGVDVKEFAGEQYLMVSAEHNFRSVPFLALNIPFLYKNSIEVILHGAIARSWTSSTRAHPYLKPTNGWYTEAGIGLSRIFGLLRFDLTYRFLRPEGLFVTVAAARII